MSGWIVKHWSGVNPEGTELHCRTLIGALLASCRRLRWGCTVKIIRADSTWLSFWRANK